VEDDRERHGQAAEQEKWRDEVHGRKFERNETKDEHG
jgi:hypothetical protein